jgi:hypothetical protein
LAVADENVEREDIFAPIPDDPIMDGLEQGGGQVSDRGRWVRVSPDEVVVKREEWEEAIAHLWALVVWFGGVDDGNPYVHRDLAAAGRFLARHRSGNMTEQHRRSLARQEGT